MEAIPGTFLDASVKRIRWHRFGEMNVHGVSVRQYTADVADGLLVAVCGQEPAGANGRLLWHVSVSHRVSLGSVDRHIRYPSWDELKHAKYTLVPENVPMVLIFPRRGVPYVDDYPTCLHLWESEDHQIDV